MDFPPTSSCHETASASTANLIRAASAAAGKGKRSSQTRLSTVCLIVGTVVIGPTTRPAGPTLPGQLWNPPLRARPEFGDGLSEETLAH